MPITRAFVLAGNATFTIQCPAGSASPKPHYTFKVQLVEASERWPESYFVKLLCGPDNTGDYHYLGKLSPKVGFVKTTAKSLAAQDSYVVRLLNRVLALVWADNHAAYEQHGYQTHHEGKCGRCGRALTVPESIESGFGPECIKHLVALTPAPF